MAGKLKPAGAKKPKPKPKKPKSGKGGKGGAGNVVALDHSRKGKNTVSRAEAVAEFEDLFELHRELGEVSGAVRKRIGDQYKTIGKKLDMPVKAVKHLFKLEKFRRENEAAEKEFDGRDRDGFLVAAQIFGDDLPMGQYAQRCADNAKRDGFGGKTARSADPDGAVVDGD